MAASIVSIGVLRGPETSGGRVVAGGLGNLGVFVLAYPLLDPEADAITFNSLGAWQKASTLQQQGRVAMFVLFVGAAAWH